LAEKTANIIDEKRAKSLTKKIKKGKFNFNDFLEHHWVYEEAWKH